MTVKSSDARNPYFHAFLIQNKNLFCPERYLIALVKTVNIYICTQNGEQRRVRIHVFVFFKICLRLNHIAPRWNQYVQHMKYPL